MALRGCFSSGGRWPGKSSQLSEFVQLQSGYAFKSEWFGPKGVRLLRNVNVAHGKVNWADEAFLPKDLCDSYERFNLNAGDIVLSLNRPFIATGTKVAKIGPADLPALLVQRVARLNISDGLLHDYLLLWLQSSLFREQVQPVSTNVAPHIAPGDISRSKLFVPDIAEQHRIVAKVDELMALCNQLEASLSTSDDHRRRLLEALLHEALQPAEVLEEAA
jgi:type I restriction enzyme S subunit